MHAHKAVDVNIEGKLSSRVFITMPLKISRISLEIPETPKRPGFAIEFIGHRMQIDMLEPFQNDPGIDRARARIHHQPFKGRKAHRRVMALTIFYGAKRCSRAEMADHHFSVGNSFDKSLLRAWSNIDS